MPVVAGDDPGRVDEPPHLVADGQVARRGGVGGSGSGGGGAHAASTPTRSATAATTPDEPAHTGRPP